MNIHLLVKILISIICIAAVSAIVLRDDKTDEYVSAYVAPEEGTIDGFTFEPEVLTYDGKGDLDFLSGVSLQGHSKQELKNLVFISIETSGTLSNKQVEYTAKTDEGKYRSVRTLQLKGYSGPKITMPKHIPDVTTENIDKFGQLLLAEEDFFVDDGFGNNASEHIEVDAEKAMNDSSLIHYTISIENIFGDRARVNQDVVLSGKHATIILSDSEVVIGIGQAFDPLSYIVRAEKADGSSAINEVLIRGEVNGESPGEYLLTYELDGQTAQMFVIVDHR